MFYFLYGDTPLPIKYDEILKEIKELTPSIPIKIFDGTQGEEELFFEAASINSIFAIKELLILKRAEKIKKLDSLLKNIANYDLSRKDVIIVYKEELDSFGRTTNPVGKKIITNAEKLGKVIEARKATNQKSIDFFIEKELNISEYEAEKLSELLGDDFFKVKNEIDKIKNFLNGETFNLDKIIPILSITEEFNIKKLVEEFLENNTSKKVISYLEESKEYMLFCHFLSEELHLILRLKQIIQKEQLSQSISYNNFKADIYPNIKKFFRNDRGFLKEYPIFLKIKVTSKYSSKFLLNKLDEILKLDYMIKSGNIDEKIGVERLILGFKN